MSACVPSQNGLFADRPQRQSVWRFRTSYEVPSAEKTGMPPLSQSGPLQFFAGSSTTAIDRSSSGSTASFVRTCAAPTVPTDITPLRARRSRPRRRPQPHRRRSRCRRRYRKSAQKRKVGRRRDAGCERRAACGFGPVEVLALMAPVAKRFLLGSAAPAQCVGRPRTTAFVRLDRREFERHPSTPEIRPVLDDDDRCVHYESELPT